MDDKAHFFILLRNVILVYDPITCKFFPRMCQVLPINRNFRLKYLGCLTKLLDVMNILFIFSHTKYCFSNYDIMSESRFQMKHMILNT